MNLPNFLRYSLPLASFLILGWMPNLFGEEYLLIANGEPMPQTTIAKLAENKTIIAVDGAANYLHEIGLIPHIVLGDFDSITDITKEQLTLKGCKMVHTPNQECTDLEKGIAYCDEMGANPITVINAIGGDRSDHMIYNIGLLKKRHKKNRSLTIITDKEILEFIKNKTITIKGKKWDHCAIIGFNRCAVTSKGLEYELINHTIDFTEHASVCNRLAQDEATIKISGEALVIRPFHL